MASEAHAEHEFTPKEYVRIAGVLFVLTAMEFSTYFIDFEGAQTPLLLGLMGIKFVLVAGFFMHLKFDTKFFTAIMGGGLGLAFALYVAVGAAVNQLPFQ